MKRLKVTATIDFYVEFDERDHNFQFTYDTYKRCIYNDAPISNMCTYVVQNLLNGELAPEYIGFVKINGQPQINYCTTTPHPVNHPINVVCDKYNEFGMFEFETKVTE